MLTPGGTTPEPPSIAHSYQTAPQCQGPLRLQCPRVTKHTPGTAAPGDTCVLRVGPAAARWLRAGSLGTKAQLVEFTHFHGINAPMAKLSS